MLLVGVRLDPPFPHFHLIVRTASFSSSVNVCHARGIVKYLIRHFSMMPLFGKKDSTKKAKKEGKDPEKPQLEDKFEMKDVLGT